MNVPARSAGREVDGVREDAEQALEVLRRALGTAWQRDDHRPRPRVVLVRDADARDWARQRGKWGDGERVREHQRDQPGRGLVDQRCECLLSQAGCQNPGAFA